ncbi:hypothetical protein BBF96_14930 [Anoxybacter fermentans]|uniref:Uncharacterized protein n=1 Tax=Anoxybacter fermentans TaxID=1323375 RepID=A0A3Q9HSW6_9FIRM|nr:hypothetical protein [Anoxybacter fermentans]AZR74568.1 hypothetical protein BBF96_14930 [Anoxybacter fermentans]
MGMYLLAGLIAAVAAYLINRELVQRFGVEIIVYITPILEEILKTGLAVFFHTTILPVHIIFGIIEGIYDLKTSKLGVSAGVLSLVWHTVFGLVTILLRSVMGNLVWGLIGAILLHYLGNSIIIKPKEE